MSYSGSMKKIFTSCVLLAFLPEGSGCCAPPTSEKLVESLQVKLNQIIVPDIFPEDLTLEEALEILRVKSREFDTTTKDTFQKGINFVMIEEGAKTRPASAGLRLKDVPLAETLRYLTGSVGMKFVVEPYAVVIREKDDERGPPEGSLTNALQIAMEKTIRPTVQFQDATIEEAVEYLRVSRGCLDADDHSSATMPLNYVLKLHPNDKRPHVSLDLKDIPLAEALRYCAEIAKLRLRYDACAVVITDDDEDRPAAPVANGPANTLVLPVVAFSGATLDEAVEFIRRKSRELDPAHNGIEVIVRPGAPKSAIELDLKQIPASEALRYIAELTAHSVRLEGNQFILAPAAEQ